ncbi:MAG TPA: APC family permease [Gammaproteobacteria bacterium]|nr:APC family permease [Gammaproteobacteria bacterium]
MSNKVSVSGKVAEPRLRRELDAAGAVVLGLGAMLGTGVFVSIGLGAGLAGPAVVLALALAAAVALANGLSSAELAAAHPVSGGTYEYGYLYLHPAAGFTAGWVFLIAKSASAATAALGFAGYLLHALGAGPAYVVPVALGAVAILTALVLTGIRRTNAANLVIVSVTIGSLLYFIVAGLPSFETANFSPFFIAGDTAGGSARSTLGALLEATALMFVAYTGYARIATLGEEVREPRRTIPRAIVITIVLVMLLYEAVAVVGTGAAGSEALREATSGEAATLAVVARGFRVPGASAVLTVGAITAMLSVLLNLILGLSRVVLAMARRGDVFRVLGTLNASRTTPYWAVLAVGVVIAGLALIGDVRTTWSFSAFTVLIYYALTNLSALRLPSEQRMFPPWIAVFGLAACLALAFWVERRVWLLGLGLIAIGLVWHTVAQRAKRARGGARS